MDESIAQYDRTTALVVVDMQNDFAHPNGSLYVTDGDRIVPIVNEEIRSANAEDAFVVYTMDWHPEMSAHFVDEGGIWPVHCVRDTWGAELHEDLVVEGPIVRKGTNGEDGYSGFTMRDPVTGETIPTELEAMLRERNIDRVVVVGLALDVCVKATALDAVRAGFQVTVSTAASRPVELQPGDGSAAIAEMIQAGINTVDA